MSARPARGPVVADTGAVLALLDRSDRHHEVLRECLEQDPLRWVLPWSILPEVDYLTRTRLGARVASAFLEDLVAGSYRVAWGNEADLERARTIETRYPRLGLGLVDGVVIAVAERLRAEAIATLDLRHFAAVEIEGSPRLFPRDLA